MMNGERVCNSCGKKMDRGYLIDEYCVYEYYCSDKCLYNVYTDYEIERLYLLNSLYWTIWGEYHE